MPSILVIDDDDLLRTMIAVTLQGAGYTVTEARDGREGIRLFNEAPSEMVLTDIVMPDTEGIGVIMELKRQYPVVGFVAMSGYNNNSTLYLDVAKKIGAHAVLSKPFTTDELIQTVEATKQLVGAGVPIQTVVSASVADSTST
jgi:CheY-like chemotaxis protein